MHLTIKEGEYKISVSIPREKLTHELLKTLVDIVRLSVGGTQEKVKEDPMPVPVVMKQQTAEKPVPVDRDTFRIRERVPNNVVDVKDLTVGMANRESALVRCPNCGQGHAAVVKLNDDAYIFMVYIAEKKEFVFYTKAPISWSSLCQSSLNDINASPEKKLAYYKDLQENSRAIPVDQPDIIVENTTIIWCPVCGEDNLFSNWKNAYYKPLETFEYDNPCLVCGGEMLESIRKNKKKGIRIMKCDCCGHTEEVKE